MMQTLRRTAILSLVAGACAMAHLTWIFAPALEVGKPATVQIGHGHEFPDSEEVVNASQIKAVAIAPSGARTDLKPSAAGKALSAPYTPKEPGLHRIAFVQDRGISSRTPTGVKPGGRDKNPTATQASRILRTGITYAAAGKPTAADGKPAGLEIELTGAFAKGVWTITLLKQGKPVPGAEVEVYLAGNHQPVHTAKTVAGGTITWKPAAAKGAALFAADWKEPAPAGANFDFTTCETSLSANW